MLSRVYIFMMSFLVAGAVSANEGKLNQNMKKESQTVNDSIASQEKIDQLSERTREMLDEYRLTLQKIENTKTYNQQMKELIDSQRAEMDSIKDQMESLKNTNKEILPLMSKMVSALEEFIALDLPFLKEERQRRLSSLKTMMKKANVSTSEKYRRVMEAYQIEAEYGRTIEAYRAAQEIEGKTLTVDFLRVGRMGLVFQTLDGARSFAWDKAKEEFQELDGSYDRSIAQGIKIARKQMAPDLVEVPVPAAEVVQ